jgi:hypothetical protein
MKKPIAVAVAVIATALTSLAQSSANLTISGTVANNTTIAVASQPGYNSLNIEAGETDKLVAIVTEKSNKRNGYTVTLQSQNAGTSAQAFLKGTGGNTDQADYTLKYNSMAVTLVSGAATITDANARTSSAGVDKNLTVTIPAAWLNTDTYSDTLTLTIAAK